MGHYQIVELLKKFSTFCLETELRADVTELVARSINLEEQKY